MQSQEICIHRLIEGPRTTLNNARQYKKKLLQSIPPSEAISRHQQKVASKPTHLELTKLRKQNNQFPSTKNTMYLIHYPALFYN
jgi:hypothetical protein